MCGDTAHIQVNHSHTTIIIVNSHSSIHLIRKYCAYKVVLCMKNAFYCNICAFFVRQASPTPHNFRAAEKGLCRWKHVWKAHVKTCVEGSRKNMLQPEGLCQNHDQQLEAIKLY